jgi:hypothetical protein
MITQKIKDLFQFIEFLHSNINNFNQYNDLIKELELLVEERKKVSHKSTFKDKLKFNEVQAEIETKSETIQANTANLIKAKAKELKVCNFENEPIYRFIAIETEIRQIENNFSIEDLPEILNHKTKYIEYREKTKGEAFLSLGFFFGDLDKGLKELFDYFIETDYNEFETFKTKAIQANDVTETAKLMQLGHSKFTLPDSFLTPSNIQQQPNIEPFQTLINPIEKQKPELNGKLIKLKNSEAIKKIHSELKGYFPKKEAELLKALQGEQLTEILLFPHSQNKFVEVFRRLKYNGFLLNTDTETKNWICTTFHFVKKGFAEPQPFKKSSVWDNLNKGKGEPTKKERICITEWLPYKSPLQLTRETENEKL